MHYTPAVWQPPTLTSGTVSVQTATQHKLDSMILLNPRILIPAGAPNHSEVMARTFNEDVLVYSLLPHAHYRGKASEFVAHFPDGSKETLLSCRAMTLTGRPTTTSKSHAFYPQAPRWHTARGGITRTQSSKSRCQSRRPMGSAVLG